MSEPAVHPRLKMALDFGPLLAFFIVNRTHGIYAATGVIMVLLVIAVAVSWKLEQKLPVMPLVSAVIVLVMGGITLYLQDERFIKIKPTLLYGLLAAVLIGGQLAGKSLLRPVLGTAIQLQDAGWRALTWRWGLFFAFMAALNEVLRRALSTDDWVTFKVFGALALTFVFMLAQMPLMKRYEIESDAPGSAP